MRKYRLNRKDVAIILKHCLKILKSQNEHGVTPDSLIILFRDASSYLFEKERWEIKDHIPRLKKVCRKFGGDTSRYYYWVISKKDGDPYTPRIQTLEYLIKKYDKKPTAFEKILVKLGLGI